MGRTRIHALGGDKNPRPKLIVAAANSAQHDEPPSTLLELALDCAKYNKLPKVGAMDDQDAGLISILISLEAVYKSFSSMRYTRQNMKDWTETNVQMWGVVGRTEKLRKDLEKANG